MYLDSVVIAGLVIVVLVCVMAIYLGIFAYKHIKYDVPGTSGEPQNNNHQKK
jgi:hypothetical protein